MGVIAVAFTHEAIEGAILGEATRVTGVFLFWLAAPREDSVVFGETVNSDWAGLSQALLIIDPHTLKRDGSRVKLVEFLPPHLMTTVVVNWLNFKNVGNSSGMTGSWICLTMVMLEVKKTTDTIGSYKGNHNGRQLL